tara:strand:- start:5617 stop:5940 length:324 start_codon:yes stop_codon:yes gene_type:complete
MKAENTTKVKKSEPALDGIPKGAEFTIEVNGKVAYLKKPDRITIENALGLAMPIQGRPQYIRAGEIVLLNCWVGGDDEIKTDDELLIPAAMQAFQIIQAKTAVLKKI